MATNIDRIRVNRTTGAVGVDIGGQAPQLDDTDKLAVSLYGKETVAGDTSYDLVSGEKGCMPIALFDKSGNGITRLSTAGDAKTVTYGIVSVGFQNLFNGVTWSRQHGNTELILLASAARTATTNSADQVNYNHRGMVVMVDVTARAAACTLTPYLDVKDSIGSDYKTIWTAAAAIDTADGSYAYLFYPSPFADAAELYVEAVDLTFGRTFRVGLTHSTANSTTYSVSAAMIL